MQTLPEGENVTLITGKPEVHMNWERELGILPQQMSSLEGKIQNTIKLHSIWAIYVIFRTISLPFFCPLHDVSLAARKKNESFLQVVLDNKKNW